MLKRLPVFNKLYLTKFNNKFVKYFELSSQSPYKLYETRNIRNNYFTAFYKLNKTPLIKLDFERRLFTKLLIDEYTKNRHWGIMNQFFRKAKNKIIRGGKNNILRYMYRFFYSLASKSVKSSDIISQTKLIPKSNLIDLHKYKVLLNLNPSNPLLKHSHKFLSSNTANKWFSTFFNNNKLFRKIQFVNANQLLLGLIASVYFFSTHFDFESITDDRDVRLDLTSMIELNVTNQGPLRTSLSLIKYLEKDWFNMNFFNLSSQSLYADYFSTNFASLLNLNIAEHRDLEQRLKMQNFYKRFYSKTFKLTNFDVLEDEIDLNNSTDDVQKKLVDLYKPYLNYSAYNIITPSSVFIDSFKNNPLFKIRFNFFNFFNLLKKKYVISNIKYILMKYLINFFTFSSINIYFIVSKFSLSASLFVDFMVLKLLQRFKLKDIMNKIINLLDELDPSIRSHNGYKIMILGRFNRRVRITYTWISKGKVSLTSRFTYMDYSKQVVTLKNGVCSIKFWLSDLT